MPKKTPMVSMSKIPSGPLQIIKNPLYSFGNSKPIIKHKAVSSKKGGKKTKRRGKKTIKKRKGIHTRRRKNKSHNRRSRLIAGVFDI